MARPLRIEFPEAWYHITCRGNEKRNIFTDDHDRIRFLEILAGNIKLYGIEVHAYALMGNHFHLLVMTPEANLGAFMQRFNTSYTVFYNRRYKRSGHLYQGRYKAILIDADQYLLELSRYIHLNPVRIKKYSALGIKEKRETINAYPWSSYRGYIDPRYQEPFVTYSMIGAMFDESGDGDCYGRYEEFVMSGIVEDMSHNVWSEVRGSTILGSERFIGRIYEQFLSKRKMNRKELPGLRDLQGRQPSMEEIAEVVAMVFNVEVKELYRPRSRCRLARSVFMELCRLYLARNESLASIGNRLGDVSVSALSQNSRRIEEKLRADEKLQEQINNAAGILGVKPPLLTVMNPRTL